jgi:HD-like signal output (HDOD) protein
VSLDQQLAPARRHCILFVDEEPGMLKAFERLLHPDRQRWEMIFVRSVPAALEALARNAVDIIVSEVRMSDESADGGLHLLGQIQREHPSVTRMVFSAPGERDVAIRLAGVAHQFLAKPFDVLGLRETLSRTCTVRELLQRGAVRDAVGGVAALPSVPSIYLELQNLLRNPRVDIKKIARVVERDLGLSAKLLQLVNSAFFSLSRHGAGAAIASVEQAVVLLGVNTLHALALASAIFVAYDGRDDLFGFSLSLMQRQSFLGARIAARLLPGRRESDEAFIAALLRDAGKLLLANRSAAAYRRIMARAAREGLPLTALETDELGTSHPEAGAYLFGIWGLPTVVVEAVAFHHEPSGAGRSRFDVTGAVHVAGALADEATAPANDGARDRPSPFDHAYLERAGVSAELPAWRALAHDMARQG